ncbi:MAG: hypothetical protein HYX78_13200 [Armatimonadetes bacterium]|nr:hypothetical protein [Armatimonadota bacterium]
MRNMKTLLTAVLLCLTISVPARPQIAGVKLVSSGEFKDKDGSLHSWKINGAHTLIWDGQPYIPLGGVFYSKYICLGQTEENWQADFRALELVKSKGITDILLKSIGPVSWTKPEAWQRLLDYLDSSGFTYGVDLADGPKAPLSGFIIEPTLYRLLNITQSSRLSFDMPDVTSAFWMLCSMADGRVITSGGATVSEGKVNVDVKVPTGESCVLLLYPERELANGGGGVADLWGGFDEFRDRFVKFASEIKFGKGLRFFVDPLSSKMDLPEGLASIIPDSADFRLEFEAYLSRKYRNIGSLNAAWDLVAGHLESFQEAARLIPLWRGTKGLPAAYDRARGHSYSLGGASKIWKDLEDFRDSSAQSYLNSAAELVKRYAADVPVIYRPTRYHRIFANTSSRGGFDGLGVEAYGHGESLVTESAGGLYGLAEESARSAWFVVTGTLDTPKRGKSSSGYPSRETLAADLDSLAEIGVKGIFVLGLQVLPEEQWKNHSLVLAPEQLDWLREFKDKYLSAGRADFVPRVVYYPQGLTVGASVKRLGPGEWWLPSLRVGTQLMMGSTVAAYTMAGQEGICIWSRSGEKTITYPLAEEQKVSLAHPSGADGILTVDKNKVALRLNSEPVLLTGMDPVQAFPLEIAEEEIAKLGPLVDKAKAAGGRAPDAEAAAERARGVLKSGRPAIAYDIAHTFVRQISEALGTYTWIEAEYPLSHNFSGVESVSGASAGGCLVLDTKTHPPMCEYSAIFPVTVTKDATYEIWISCTPRSTGCSPFSYSLDNGIFQSASSSMEVSAYAGLFAWSRVGIAKLSKGQHQLQIRVDGPGLSGKYNLDIDTIVLCPIEFKPEGIKKP